MINNIKQMRKNNINNINQRKNMINDIKKIDRAFIIKCINTLDDKPYQNEAQFRDALVNKIRENVTDLVVNIEVSAWHQNIVNSNTERKRIDIVISDKNGDYVAIELKYKTKDKTTNTQFFTYIDNNGEKVRIAAQGGNTGVRYEFIKDINRLELLLQKNISLYDNHIKYNNLILGLAIMVTNDDAFINKHYNNNLKVLYNSVCIGDGDYIQEICQSSERNKHNDPNYYIYLLPNAKYPGKSKYKCDWESTPFYVDPQKKINNNPDFQYLVIEVK